MKSQKDEKGSFTLEATIIFPFFVAFMLLLINFVNVACVYLAMDHAVSEATKQIATHIYPAKYLHVPQKTADDITLTLDPQELLDQLLTNMAAKTENWAKEQVTAIIMGGVTERIAAELIKAYLPTDISPDSFSITQLKIYNPNKNGGTDESVNDVVLGDEDIAITVEYKVKMPVPFFPVKEITLSNTAVERAWIDLK